jgi:hypothetical protein
VAGNEIDEIRAQRFAFLHAAYKAAGGDTQQFMNTDPIAEELGFDSGLVTKFVSYLREEHLLDEPVMGHVVQLTHWGLKEVEEALSAPDEPTEHFLPFSVTDNIIHVESMTNSQILQGSPGASQTQKLDTEALRALVEGLRAAIPQLGLEGHQAAEAFSDLATLEAQASSPRPKLQIVRDSLMSLNANPCRRRNGSRGGSLGTGLTPRPAGSSSGAAFVTADSSSSVRRRENVRVMCELGRAKAIMRMAATGR